MKKSILLFISILSILSINAQTQPVLIGMDGSSLTIFTYTVGDTFTSNKLTCRFSLSNGVFTEAPNGKLYGLDYGDQGDYGNVFEYDYFKNTTTLSTGFSVAMGYYPSGALLLARNNKLYGRTLMGGANNTGSLFSYTIGRGITKLMDMPAFSISVSQTPPFGPLVQATDGYIYGLSNFDGIDSGGTIYKWDIAANAYTVVHSFSLYGQPSSNMIITGDTFYGMMSNDRGYGNFYRFEIATGIFTSLDTPSSFVHGNSIIQGTNGLIYGLCSGAGAYGKGVLFSYNINTGVYDTLHSFGGGPDGYYPYGSLYQASDGMLYGWTSGGGANGYGVIFQYDITTASYSIMVNLTSSVANPEFGHPIEYKVQPVFSQPLDSAVCPGSIVSFTASDTASWASAQWQVSTDSGNTYTNIPGATDTIYSFTASVSQNGYQYRGVLTHGGISDTSMAATLTVWYDTASYYPTICYGQSLTVGSHTYNTTGVYHDTLSGASIYGCDSMVTTHLSVLPPDTASLVQAICSGQNVMIGTNSYHTSGNYIDTLYGASINGCDSIVKLFLTVYPLAADTFSDSICSGQSYTFGGNAYTAPGTYIDTLPTQSINGCDSLQILTLTVHPAAQGNVIQAICPGTGYTLGANTYTVTGIYDDTLTGAGMYGCDSVVTVNLFVLDSTTAYFYLQPSDTPHVWFIILPNAGNNITCSWSWGDSTSSIGDTVSHTYASAGYYTICLTVTDSAGCAATYCDTNVYLYKNQSGQMVYVQVLPQYPAGINTINTASLNINYYAGAVHFSEALQAPTQLRLYDMSGRVVMRQDNFAGNVWNINSDIAQGVYIIQLQNGSYSLSKKLMVFQ